MSGRLFVVSTPIGNLEDVTVRAKRILAEVALVACEDTRRTGKLYELLGISRPDFIRLDAHTEAQRLPRVLDRLAYGDDVALVSDAGTPGVSDPGARLLAAAAAQGVSVQAVPGASATLAALVSSGLPMARFAMEGFLPRKGAERHLRLAAIAADDRTTVIFESPRRVAATLKDLKLACGDTRPASVCRELTKLHEEVVRGTLSELCQRFAGELRGEVVIVVGPAEIGPVASDTAIAAALAVRRRQGLDRKSAVIVVMADLAVAKRRVYDLALDMDW
jgi:16S rRNA (cytidine1402-2'-O)-methyltransferase